MDNDRIAEFLALDAVERLDLFKGARKFFHLPGGRVHYVGLDAADMQMPGEIGEDGFRRFSTNEEAQRYGDEKLDIFNRLPVDQQRAIRGYTRSSWPYNAILRSEDPQKTLNWILSNPNVREELLETFDGKLPTLSDINDRIALMDQAVSHPLHEGIEARREIGKVNFMKGYGGADPRGLIGTVQTEQGFISASLGTPPSFQFSYHLHLLVPSGYSGLWIGRSSVYPNQREFLLPRGTNYHIAAAFFGRNSRWDISSDI
jgi:hypothetical protein